VRRALPTLAAALVAAVLLSACGGVASSPAAAKVNSTRILRSTLDDQLAVLVDNEQWLRGIAPQLGEGAPLTEPNGNVSTRLTAAWLTALMNQAVVDQTFRARNLEVTDADREAAEESAQSLFNTEQGQTFDSMPKWFRDDFIEDQARYEAVSKVVPPNPVATDAQVADLFERTKTQYCPSGNAVSHILQNTLAEAQQIEAALAAGEDYATLARRSEDTSTDTAGGFLTCTGSPNYTQLPEALRQAVDQVPVGGVSAPVQTEFGYHVLRVTPFDLPNVRTFVADLYRRSLSPPMTQFINNRLLKAKIWVDPRYGSVARGPVRIEPPRPPEPRSKPAPSTAPPGSTGP
jgi:parvulin-like peptidyl-prolyl isomerase